MLGRLGKALLYDQQTETVVEKRPKALTHAYVHSVFRDKPIQANTNALVHLYLGCRILEYLVERGVVNYGKTNKKIIQANEIVKANLQFIHSVTTAFEDGRTIRKAKFNQFLQERIQKTAEKMIAILGAGEAGKLGEEDSELAKAPPAAVRAAAALYVHDVMTLFGLDAPIAARAEKLFRADADWASDSGHADFLKFMRTKMKKGNGTSGYRYVRTAGTGIVSMMRDDDGVDAILGRVDDSVQRSGGPLANEALAFHDVPGLAEDEEKESLTTVFDMERIEVAQHAAGLAMFGGAIVRWLRGVVAIDELLERRLTEIAMNADEDDVKIFAELARNRKIQLGEALLPGLSKNMSEMGIFFIREEEARPIMRAGLRLRLQMAYIAQSVKAVAEHDGMTLVRSRNPSDIERVRSYCAALAAPFDSVAEREFVVLSDGDATPTESRVHGFDIIGEAMGDMSVMIRKTLEEEGFVPFEAFSPSRRLKSADDMTEKLALFFNYQAFRGAGGLNALLAGD